MFKEERKIQMFDWSMIGDIGAGRANLGRYVGVEIYRLMQFTVRDVLIRRWGVEATDEVMYEAGKEAGIQFFKNVITKKDGFNEFIADLQSRLIEYKIGILRVEKADTENLTFMLTMSEDLDCSGLPVSNEVICKYDEGFLDGVLKAYTGRDFIVKEIDCWCSGDRVCRFSVKPA